MVISWVLPCYRQGRYPYGVAAEYHHNNKDHTSALAPGCGRLLDEYLLT